MLQNKQLDFLVIGAQKCATSWIYQCLNEHPEILLPNQKMEIGYIGGDIFNKEGEDWYFGRFEESKPSQLVGDVSVDYLYDMDSPDNIQPYVNNPKLIASLRNPVDRLVSSYFWLMRKRLLPELKLEEGIAPLLDEPVGFPNKIDSPLEEIVRRGCYDIQLENFLSKYEQEQFLILVYEQIKSDSPGSIKKIYDFLEIDENFVPSNLNSRPKKNTYNKTLLKFERMVDRKYLVGKVIAKVANKANQVLAKVQEPKPDLSAKTRRRLYELFEPRIQKTKKILTSLPESRRPSDQYLQQMWKSK